VKHMFFLCTTISNLYKVKLTFFLSRMDIDLQLCTYIQIKIDFRFPICVHCKSQALILETNVIKFSVKLKNSIIPYQTYIHDTHNNSWFILIKSDFQYRTYLMITDKSAEIVYNTFRIVVRSHDFKNSDVMDPLILV
jgi:hypothetical protein